MADVSRKPGELCDAILQADPLFCISGFKNKTVFRRLEDIEKLEQALRKAGVPE